MSKQQIYTISCEDAVAFLCEAAWGFAEVDADGNFIWINTAYAEALNAPVDLVLGTNYRTWTHPDDVDVDVGLATQVATGEINYYTLAKRYVQRGSTKAVPRVIWGMLSVQGKYSAAGEFMGYRAQFRPYSQSDHGINQYLQSAKAVLLWTKENWKLITTIVAVSSTLIFGGSRSLMDFIQKAKSATESVQSELDSSRSGSSPVQP